MWSNDRAAMRQVFYTAWQHFQDQKPLAGVEAVIVEALLAHPEYHALFAEEPSVGGSDPMANPFLHLGLHIALAEQISTDRPPGIAEQWRRLQERVKDPHHARHLMMECLEETLRGAQEQGRMPDEASYIACLRELP